MSTIVVFDEEARRRYLWWGMLVLLAIAGTLSVLWAASRGAGISPDSTVYIGQARHWLNLVGFKFAESASDDFPPLYSMLLAMGGLLTRDPATAARWMNAGFFGANVVLVGLMLRRLLRGAFWAPLLAAWFLLTSVDMLTLHVMAWSEPAFLFFGYSGLFLLASYLEQPRFWNLILASLAIAAALLDRYMGIGFVLTGTIALLILGSGGLRRRMTTVVLFAVITCLPLALWSWHHPSNRQFLPHLLPLDYFIGVRYALSSWIVPTPLLVSTLTRALIIFGVSSLIALGIIMAWRFRSRDSTPAGPGPGHPKLFYILALFVVCYFIMLVLATSLFGGMTSLSQRYIEPWYPGLLVLILYGLHRAVFSAGGRQPVLQIGFGALTLVCAIVYFYSASIWVARTHDEGLGYSSRAWQESPIISQVNILPTGIKIYSNGSDAIYYLASRRAYRLPDRVDATNMVVNRDYSPQIAQVGTELAQGRTVIVYMNNFPERWYQPTEAELQQELPLRLIVRKSDGAIYQIVQ